MVGKRILVCAGHYRDERGAKNKYLRLSEWSLVAPFCLKLVERLRQESYETVTCFNHKLTEKVKTANDCRVDLALDIHLNALDMSYSGHLCMHWHNSVFGKEFADVISSGMLHNKQRPNIPVSRNREKGGYFLSKTMCPAVIIELGFIDNIDDLTAVLFPSISIVDAIVNGIDLVFRNCELYPQFAELMNNNKEVNNEV